VTIALALTDRVDDTPRFLAALRDAQRYMATLRPAAIVAAIEADAHGEGGAAAILSNATRGAVLDGLHDR
jgi:hypothetical protein